MLSIGRRQLLAICGHIANLLAFTELESPSKSVLPISLLSTPAFPLRFYGTPPLPALFTLPSPAAHKVLIQPEKLWRHQLGSRQHLSGFTTRKILEAPAWAKTTSVRVYHICCDLPPLVVVGSSCLEDGAVHASR